MTNFDKIICDFNIAFYTVASKCKYTHYVNNSDFCIWYIKDIKVAHYDKKQELLYIYKYK